MTKLKLIILNGKFFFFVVLAFVFLLTIVSAQDFPKPQGYVNDFAHVLNSEDYGALIHLTGALKNELGVEVVIVTVQTTSPLEPAQYRTELFNEWGIGSEDTDNGLLILYSFNENRIEVETGYSLEGILPDSKLGRLLDENYVPYRDQGQVSKGILAFTLEVAKILDENKDELETTNKQSFDMWKFLIIIILIFLVFILIRSIVRRSYGSYGSRRVYWFPVGGPSFGGGSFGGFGGGHSGGGGVGR